MSEDPYPPTNEELRILAYREALRSENDRAGNPRLPAGMVSELEYAKQYEHLRQQHRATEHTRP